MARIAHFIDTHHSGGAERVVVDLCGKLAGMGHEVEVWHFGNGWIEKYAQERHFGSYVLGHESWYRSKWSVGVFSIFLAVLLRQRRIELLHSHLNGSILAGAIATAIAGTPHVGTMHDVYHIKEHPSRLKMLRVIASLGTQLVTVSDQMRRFYSGLAEGKTFFERVHNGVDTSAFGQPAKRRNEKFTFVSVGRLVSLKGFDVLLEALARTGPGGPDLRILGEGKDLAELETRAQLLGIEDRVEFLGFRDDVAEVLSNADAFVLASRSEGLSCSVVEAMAAGLPCVVTAVGGNSELVADGETGFLVPSEDPTALAAKLTQLSSDRELSRALGAGGRKRVADYFSIEATVRNYLEIYRALLPGMKVCARAASS